MQERQKSCFEGIHICKELPKDILKKMKTENKKKTKELPKKIEQAKIILKMQMLSHQLQKITNLTTFVDNKMQSQLT